MSQLPSTPSFKSTMELFTSSMDEVSKLLSPTSEAFRTTLEDNFELDTQVSGGK